MEHSRSRVVVITGGSRGIGRSVAFKFAKEGARIILAHFDADESAARETLDNLESKGITAEAHKLDVSSFESVDHWFGDIFTRFEGVDVLVNNAGITRDTLLMRMGEEEWDAVLGVNLKGVFNCTRAVVRPMIKQRSGRIVNITSVVGQIGNAGQANYAASKAGVMGLTKTTARELAGRGITVNGVAPGFIDTEMTAALSDKVKESFLSQIPMGRMGMPDDVAETVYWLCSDAAGYITGQIIHVNGGMYM
ncbi:MAG: 3-oxoacyl-[acyl-carrier-protein] reductase [Deltaproteobacteria bacterium]|nr:3-oxoacyl-[acyl-carrier-protein] reductase [Deltaproteobacteria bacterium]